VFPLSNVQNRYDIIYVCGIVKMIIQSDNVVGFEIKIQINVMVMYGRELLSFCYHVRKLYTIFTSNI
jgi:hypothetical protein